MGVIFSRIRLLPRRKKSSKETLEALESELQLLTKTREGSQQCERTINSLLLIFLLVTFPLILIVGVVAWMWFADALTNAIIAIYLLLIITLPIVIYGLKKGSNAWFTHRKAQYNSALQSVHTEKKKVLEEVMDKEPYKVARELLEKYDPRNPTLLPKNAPVNKAPDSVRQRRPVQQPSIPQTPHPALQYQTPARTPHIPLNTPRTHPAATPFPPSKNNVNATGSNNQDPAGTTPFVTKPSNQPRPIALEQAEGQQFVPPGHCLGLAPGPPAPLPILPRERTSFDKVMDFMLGDGPNNRYALVCSECYSHNGMALKDEFEYLSFRCAYCYHLNEARKSRPSSKKLSLPEPSPATFATTNNDNITDSNNTTDVPSANEEQKSNNAVADDQQQSDDTTTNINDEQRNAES